MGWRCHNLLRRLILVAAVAMGALAMVFCGVGPLLPRADFGTTICSDSSWGDPSPAAEGPTARAGAARSVGESVPSSPSEGESPSLRGRLIEDVLGGSLDSFFESLAAVERSEAGLLARISWFGDSHTAADFMTGQLRRRLQKRFGDGGHGFIAAGRPWPSYRHRNVKNGCQGHWETQQIRHNARSDEVDTRLGLAGVSVETDRPDGAVWVTTDGEGPVGNHASRFELYYLAQPSGGRVSLQLDEEEVARLSTRALELGPGYFAVEAEDGPHQLRVESQGRGMVRLFGVVVEREGPGVTVDSLGINGARVTAMLGWDEDLFAQNLSHRAPDLVVLWYGANSVGDDWYDLEQYEQWFIDALARVRRAVPEASCLIVGPPDMARASLAERGGGGTPPNLHNIIAAQRDAAGLVGCGFFDMFEAMGGENSNLRWGELDPSRVSGDGIHFTTAGYEALADLLYESLVDGYEQYLEAHPEQ